MSMTTNKQALREAAENATQEKWSHLNGVVYAHTEETEWELFEGYAHRAEDAVFVTSANPKVVLALLDELEAKDGRIAEVESQRRMAFMACNRWADKFREAEKRIAELIKAAQISLEYTAGLENQIESAELRISELEHRESNNERQQVIDQLARAGESWDEIEEYMQAWDADRAAGITTKGE